MAERVTLAQVERTLELFAREMGTETYTEARKAGRPTEGTYTLSVQRLEGYRIRVERILSEGGAVTCPFGYTVRNAREMEQTLRFGLDVLREQRALPPIKERTAAGIESDIDRRNREAHERAHA